MRLRIHMTPMKISMIALVLMVLIVAVGGLEYRPCCYRQ